MNITIHNEGEPTFTENWWRGEYNDYLFWFKVDSDQYCRIEWFFPKSVPGEIKEQEEEILEYCKALLL
jgi:hypothetical protein